MKLIFLLISTTWVFFSFEKKELSWVAIGDSITYLNDHPNETGNRISAGYMTRVSKELPQVHFINQGHNGWTARNIADNIEKLGLIKADLYSIFLGTNDWWQSIPVGSFTDYLHQTGSGTAYGSFRIIINKIRSLNPNASIIMITPMQRTDFVYINDPLNNAYGSYKEKGGQSLEQFSLAIDSIAQYEHLKMVDLYHKKGMELKDLVKFKRLRDPQNGKYKNIPYPYYIGMPYQAGIDDYPYPENAIGITYDGLHPSNRGYALIADALVNIIKKL